MGVRGCERHASAMRATQNPRRAQPSTAHQLVGAAGDDQVDDIVQLEEVVNLIPRRHQANEVAPHAGRHRCDRVHNQSMQRRVGARCLLATLLRAAASSIGGVE